MSDIPTDDGNPLCPRCKQNTRLSAVGDTSSSGIEHEGKTIHIAMNIYICHLCMTVGRENVWQYPGIVWVMPEDVPKQ